MSADETLIEQAKTAALEAAIEADKADKARDRERGSLGWGHYHAPSVATCSDAAATTAMRTLLKGLKGESVLLRAFAKDDEANRSGHHVLEQFESRCDELLADLEPAPDESETAA